MTMSLRWLSPILATPFILAGCGGGNEPTATQTQAAASPEAEAAVVDSGPNYGGNLIIASIGEPVIFNDHYAQDVPSGDINDLIYAGLTTSNENLEIIPDIAIGEPQISEDGLQWTFDMKEGVLFHDGVELTAHDVVYTYSIFLDEDYTGPRAGSFTSLENIEALSDYQVRFTLSEPDARFATLTGYGILPRHLLEDVPIAELGDYQAFNIDQPIGAGPFRFVSWTSGQNLVLEAFEDYHGGRPYLDRVTFRFVQDLNAMVLLLGQGEVHYAAGIPPEELPTVESFDNVDVHSTLALRYDFLGYNLRNPLFQDKRVRQALTHAIDRQEIVDTVMEGNATVAHAPVSPLSWAYNDDVPVFNFDPERAKALLAEAGWVPGSDGIMQKDGERFSFEILSNDGNNVRRDLGIIVQQQLAGIGIEVTPRQMEWGAFLDRILAPNFDFDATILAWGLALDPDPSAIWHSREIEQGLNNIGYSSPVVDALAESNIRIMDQEERAAELAKVWAELAEDQPYTFMWYPLQFVGLNQRVQGFVHHPRADMHSVPKLWMAD